MAPRIHLPIDPCRTSFRILPQRWKESKWILNLSSFHRGANAGLDLARMGEEEPLRAVLEVYMRHFEDKGQATNIRILD